MSIRDGLSLASHSLPWLSIPVTGEASLLGICTSLIKLFSSLLLRLAYS